MLLGVAAGVPFDFSASSACTFEAIDVARGSDSLTEDVELFVVASAAARIARLRSLREGPLAVWSRGDRG